MKKLCISIGECGKDCIITTYEVVKAKSPVSDDTFYLVFHDNDVPLVFFSLSKVVSYFFDLIDF